VLPNLIVIGAAKCGTTSLHEYLNEHPQISMSREKELHFFVEEKNWGRERMAETIPDARLVYLVRDPPPILAAAGAVPRALSCRADPRRRRGSAA